jgi:hypothetical protein
MVPNLHQMLLTNQQWCQLALTAPASSGGLGEIHAAKHFYVILQLLVCFDSDSNDINLTCENIS